MEKETAFIIKFTIGFVVAAIVLIGIGYAAITVLGSLDLGNVVGPATPTPFVPTPDPQTTPDPTTKIVVPATPTPMPTPVPTSYTVYVNYEGDASSRTYTVSFTLGKNSAGKMSDPIDMNYVRFSVWNSGSTRQEYTYSQAFDHGAGWSHADGDTMLEADEAFVIKVNYYELNIQPDTESRVSFLVDEETIKATTLPVLINPVVTGEPPDPEASATPNPYY